MAVKWWLDGRDDLHWWQHRHPNTRIRAVGIVVMGAGAGLLVRGLIALLSW